MTVERIQKQYVIAVAVLAGFEIAHVARQLGVPRSWASREANSAGVRNIMAEVLLRHADPIERTFELCRDAIEEALQAADAPAPAPDSGGRTGS